MYDVRLLTIYQRTSYIKHRTRSIINHKSFNCQKTLIVSRGPLRKIVDHTNGEKLQNHKQKCDQVGLFLKSLVDNFFIKVVNFL